MIKLEDILDSAARYIRGEMDKEEIILFEKLLDKHTHLREELRFMQMVQVGLADLEQEEIEFANSKSHKKRSENHWRKNKRQYLIICVIILILLSIFGFKFFYKKDSKNPRIIYYANAVKEGKANLNEGHFLIIEQFGGGKDKAETDRGLGVNWTSSGQIAFSGIYEGIANLGPFQVSNKGKQDAIFGLYDMQEGFIWVASFGNEKTRDLPRNLTVDSKDNIILTGDFGEEVNFGKGMVKAIGHDNEGNHDFFIAKYSEKGQLEWVDHGGGDRVAGQQTGWNCGFSVTTDNSDNVIVCGNYIGSPLLAGKQMPVGAPSEDLFIIKYDPNGNPLWINAVTCKYMIYGYDLKSDFQGNIFVTGSFGHHNLSGEAYFGEDTLISFGGKDIFLAKYDPNGNLLWVRQAGSTQNNQGYEAANSIALDDNGDCIIAGEFVGHAAFGKETIKSLGFRDIFLAKYSKDGEELWTSQAGGPLGGNGWAERVTDIAINPDGYIIATGAFADSATFDSKTLYTNSQFNFFIAKYSPNGEVVWLEQFEMSDPDQQSEGASLDVNENGDIVVTGFFTGTISIGETLLQSVGKEDIFILVFNETGDVISAKSVLAYM